MTTLSCSMRDTKRRHVLATAGLCLLLLAFCYRSLALVLPLDASTPGASPASLGVEIEPVPSTPETAPGVAVYRADVSSLQVAGLSIAHYEHHSPLTVYFRGEALRSASDIHHVRAQAGAYSWWKTELQFSLPASAGPPGEAIALGFPGFYRDNVFSALLVVGSVCCVLPFLWFGSGLRTESLQHRRWGLILFAAALCADQLPLVRHFAVFSDSLSYVLDSPLRQKTIYLLASSLNLLHGCGEAAMWDALRQLPYSQLISAATPCQWTLQWLVWLQAGLTVAGLTLLAYGAARHMPLPLAAAALLLLEGHGRLMREMYFVMSEPLALALTAASAGAFLAHCHSRGRGWLMAALACAFVLFHVRPAGLFVFVAVAIFALVLHLPDRKALRFAAMACCVTAACLAMGPVQYWMRHDVFMPAPMAAWHPVGFGLFAAQPEDVQRMPDATTRQFFQRCMANPDLLNINDFPCKEDGVRAMMLGGLDNNLYRVALVEETAMHSQLPEKYLDPVHQRLFATVANVLYDAHKDVIQALHWFNFPRAFGFMTQDALNTGSLHLPWLPLPLSLLASLIALVYCRRGTALGGLALMFAHALHMYVVCLNNSLLFRYVAASEFLAILGWMLLISQWLEHFPLCAFTRRLRSSLTIRQHRIL